MLGDIQMYVILMVQMLIIIQELKFKKMVSLKQQVEMSMVQDMLRQSRMIVKMVHQVAMLLKYFGERSNI